MLNRKLLFSLLALLINSAIFAQSVYQDYFLFPIKPGQKNYLAGTMGELRPNHFHGGIDIKTDGRTGLPVYCAADGYISRLKVATSGYGNAIYIDHPNGYTTVYAHLEKFEGKLAEHVKKQQYEQKTFEIELFFKKGEFAYKRGDIIAIAGNTGSSTAPHLHFEIRDKNENPLNPLDFGFRTEIKDDIAPKLYECMLTPLHINARVENKFDPYFFKPTYKSSNEYVYQDTIEAFGQIGLAIKSNDFLNGASNKNGVPLIVLKVNNEVYYEYSMHRFNFLTQKEINTIIDYEQLVLKGDRFQKLYNRPSNRQPACIAHINKGMFVIEENKIYIVEVLLADIHGNKTTFKFNLKGKKSNPNVSLIPLKSNKILKQETRYNILIVKAEKPDPLKKLKYKSHFLEHECDIAYYNTKESVYLIDMNKGLPDSIYYYDSTYSTNLKHIIIPGKKTTVYTKNFNLTFPENALFDTLYLEIPKQRNTFAIGLEKNPLKGNVLVSIKTNPNEYSNKEKTHAYMKSGSSKFPHYKFEGGTWNNNILTFKTKYFGEYVLLDDKTEPSARMLRRVGNEISFKISDELSGIKSFNAYLNGQWVLMNYEHKTGIITSDLPSGVTLRGDFVLHIKDNAGNKKTLTLQF